MSFRYPLDLQLFSGEKSEKATPKKRGDARKKGQVSKSTELSGSITLLSAFICLLIFGGYFKERIVFLYTDIFINRLTTEITINNVMMMFREYGIQILLLLAPLFLVLIVMALISSIMQVGFLLTGEPLKMQFSKLSPIKGFQNIFSMRSLVEFAKSILKMIVIGYLVYTTLWGKKVEIASLSEINIDNILIFMVDLTMDLGIKIAIALLILAVFDFIYQRYEHEKGLKMSKQDIKDEYKKMEGDPLVKGKIKERQRRMAMQRMMQEIPNADVIITNPTHFAIALKYDASEMEAPTIIAKGQDYVALRIREIAKEHGIITMENKPLARALYKRAEIGDSIPADLFQAVAEVLAYVYKLKGKTK
ncbi:flagellar biosynthesis protein FlhB [Paenibacillus crassostreae]|uniref:Flagellar biosynthetic protein FlhB n=1 Tax=Paenibacillus crassostreae TaxID=1763538 RepID=A0A167FN29_9BACL|nr:flagellar biosynthesis protein FlhB [Paenibacillus crassostreae]AOZ94236.1 flagellar biosynthesis protein FlhB [Paenibacillus crassostreae]OAB76728.1 EscU/YscU/HrcU family type III secretion system export apparatus switch protein [Paenibacillus crassostreae]